MNGREIRALRKSVGATMAEVARDIGCSEAWVSRMETGSAPVTMFWAQRLQEILPPYVLPPAPVSYPRTGKDVRRIRKALGLSQCEMSEAVGVSASYLGNVESGHRGVTDWLRRMIHLRYGEFIE